MAVWAVAVALALTVGSASATEVNITLLPLSTGAAALDGTPYGFFFVKGSGGSKQWTISIQGGGWCVGEADCLSRSEMTVHDGKPGERALSRLDPRCCLRWLRRARVLPACASWPIVQTPPRCTQWRLVGDGGGGNGDDRFKAGEAVACGG